MNEYIEVAGKIKDTVSEFIPAKLSVIIKLAELAFDTFGKVDDSLNSLYKKAFKEVVEKVAKDESIGNIRKLLNEFKSIDSFTSLQELTEHIAKTSKEMGLYLDKNDFTRITDNISDEFNNVLLDDRYDKLYKCFMLRRETNNLDKEIRDIKKLLNEIYDRAFQLKTDNKSYALNYIESLFMHTQGISISLKNIFVVPNIHNKHKRNYDSSTIDSIRNFVNKHKEYYEPDAIDALRDFMNEDYRVLFIEGCGGYGKSSIVSFLAYNYLFNSANDNISFLVNRQLIIVRLRECTGESSKINAIKNRLNKIDAIEKDAVLIFDGLDELCMIDNGDGSVIAKDIIKAFRGGNRKIIITSRPTCVNYNYMDSLNISYEVIEICCFDETKRIKFADSFSEIDKKHMEAVEYVKNLPLNKKKNESIYGSPFLLYLILSGGINEEEKENSWLLMHRLFHDDLFNPPYSYDRCVDKRIAKVIYQVNCDIAYEMFKSKNQKLFMTTNELKQLLPESDVNNLIKKSHGLFSYMRKSLEGTVEFVHNHIRDYFLCEKILMEINNWYSDQTLDGYQIASNLCDLLKYDYFTDEVKQFIGEAMQYCDAMRNKANVQYDEDYSLYRTILDKCDVTPLSYVFDWFYKSGGAVKYAFTSSNGYDYKSFSKIVVDNSSCVYRNIYKLKLKKGEYLRWFSDKMLKKAEKNLIYDCFREYID